MTTTDTPILYDVFISYARADGRDLAEHLYLALKDRGLRPWRDERDLNPYQDFSVGIERAIRASRYVIVLLTPQIAERDDSFVRREILEAQARHKPIIPLITSGFDAADVPISIKHLTYLNFTDFDRHLSDLLNRIAESPGDYKSPPPSDDPFRPYVEQLRDFVVGELEVSLLNIHDLILLRAKNTPDAVETKPPPPLPTAFRSRVLSVNPKSDPSPLPERDFDDFNTGFAAHDGRVLLLGEPGAGKTTTLLTFTREKAIARLSNPIAPLPIYAPLSSWDGKTELTDWLASATGLDPAALRHEITANRALLIFDGLDEMTSSWHDPSKPDAPPRDFRLEFLDKLRPLDTAALISCRVKDYDDIVAKGGEKIALNGAITLQPLSDHQIRAYLHDQPELWDALQSDSALLDMGRTPLLLTLLAIGYRDSTPEERAQLRDLSASPGDLRDRIFETYIRKRYEHEQLHGMAPLPYSLGELIEQLGKAILAMLRTRWNDSTLLTETDFEVSDRETLTNLAVRLHLLQPAGKLKSWTYRGEAIENLWRFLHLKLRDHIGFSQAITALNSPQKQIRARSATALGQIKDSRAVEPLIFILTDQEMIVRNSAIESLGQFGDTRALKPLITILCTSTYDGETLIRALVRFGAAAVEPLILALRSPEWRVRYCAATALHRIGFAAVDSLIAALSKPPWHFPTSAVDVLGSIGDRRAVDPLIAILSASQIEMRLYAAEALGRIGDRRAVMPLIDALDDASADVRRNIAIALGKLGDQRAVEPLKYLLSDIAETSDYRFEYDEIHDSIVSNRVCDHAAEALAAVEAWRREQGSNPQQ